MGPAIPQRAGEALHEEGIGLINADDGFIAQSFYELDVNTSEENLYDLIPEDFKWQVPASPAPASPADDRT